MLRILSGGQSGVDRAALDAAIELHFPCGGWCPRARWAEDGPIPARYPLTETPLADPAQRTEWNVRDAQGILVLSHGTPQGGTALAIAYAARLGKPVLLIDVNEPCKVSEVADWLTRNRIAVLNVAGPRESECPGMFQEAKQFLRALLPQVRAAHEGSGQ